MRNLKSDHPIGPPKLQQLDDLKVRGGFTIYYKFH